MTDWTADDVEKLNILWDKGKSAREIAEAMGEQFSRNAVIGKAHRLGLSSRRVEKTSLIPASFQPHDRRACQYPLWGDLPTHEYCGEPIQEGSPYCPTHHARCYRKPGERDEVEAA